MWFNLIKFQISSFFVITVTILAQAHHHLSELYHSPQWVFMSSLFFHLCIHILEI